MAPAAQGSMCVDIWRGRVEPVGELNCTERDSGRPGECLVGLQSSRLPKQSSGRRQPLLGRCCFHGKPRPRTRSCPCASAAILWGRDVAGSPVGQSRRLQGREPQSQGSTSPALRGCQPLRTRLATRHVLGQGFACRPGEHEQCSTCPSSKAPAGCGSRAVRNAREHGPLPAAT